MWALAQLGLISDHLGDCQEKFASGQLEFWIFNPLAKLGK
jgi:hypothetical protein